MRLSKVAESNISIKIGISLLFLMGAGFVTIGIFPTRAPGAANSVKAMIHLQTARGISVVFPLACLFVGIGLNNNRQWQFVRLFTLVSGVFGLLFTAAGGVATITGADWMGGIERVIVINGLVWVEVVCVHLLFPQLSARLNNMNSNKNSAQTALSYGTYNRLIPVFAASSPLRERIEVRMSRGVETKTLPVTRGAGSVTSLSLKPVPLAGGAAPEVLSGTETLKIENRSHYQSDRGAAYRTGCGVEEMTGFVVSS